jgi:MYXO-CTERM domain-containing protein
MKNAMMRIGLAAAVLGLVAGAEGRARADITGVTLGTAAPPSTLGGYSMTPFATDTSPIGTPTTTLTTPDGTLTFATPFGHYTVGDGWATWSNGYTGDVYTNYTSFSQTMTLSPGAGAFIFYTEPDNFATYTFTAKASDGTTITQDIAGDAGAAGFGFYTSAGTTLTSVTVSSSDDFAVGEFSIAPAISSATPEPSNFIFGGLAGLAGLGYAWRRRREMSAA